MAKDNKYEWKYCSIGGVVRVKIESGEDIAHLGELDQKLWTVLSCPSTGLEFDQKTLDLLDSDGDGRIRVAEVVAAAEWITSVVKDRDRILAGESTLPLSQIDTGCEAGKKLYDSARQILSNLGLEKDDITIEEASDSVAIFAKTKLNGDGIITPASADDEALQKTISDIAASVGSAVDRSGEAGITADHIEAFYAACADYAAWQKAAADNKAQILPYGDNTEAALAACEAVKDKIADYYMRCKLIGFDGDAAQAVDVSVDRISSISQMNLATQSEEIATYPIARPTRDGKLPFDSVNPAWQPAFATLRSLVLDADLKGKDSMSEEEWNGILAKFAPYNAWKAEKKGAEVEPLGLDRVSEIIKADSRQALLDLVAADKALEAEASSIDDVCKLLHYYRYFASFLKNYVFLADFYGRADGTRGMFEVGQLYIDQRCCDLCIKVDDMGKHADMAGLSGMFLIYATCTSKTLGQTMNIVAVMTDGGIKNLRPGVNAVFYDLKGQDWDAVVTKIVDNPISVKQAFWSPYRKFANTITERINKSAAEKETRVSGNMTAAANNVNVPAGSDQAAAGAAAAPAQQFDIAKFAGIFAAIGMALGMIGSAIMKLIDPWTNVIILFIVLIICISGPSMFLAWQKLRRRNLGPVLNANGWAINSVVLVNILFGRTLTTVAKYPKMNLDDPYAKKKTPAWIKWLIGIVIVLAGAFAALYFTDNLKFMGIERKAKVEQVAEETAAEEQVEEAAAEEAAPEEEVAE